jgi:curli biogenesis system outer membrane secretion channel CsgG
MNIQIGTLVTLLTSFCITLHAQQFIDTCFIPASKGNVSSTGSKLSSLPFPKEKIVVAVYKFRDQTGQYKQGGNGQTWSTAVTQGGTSVLIKALQDSRWFLPVEREALPELLNERKIIDNTREQYAALTKTESRQLPGLTYASLILEGGIISYESNVITGGAGARYFGIGGNTTYQQDQVSVFLRAISTQNGQILKTVYTTKTILSKMVDFGVYRFVQFKRLLEIESGITVNEPPQHCVQEAIEKAVMDLIIEGIQDSLWQLKNPSDSNNVLVKNYLQDQPLPSLSEKKISINQLGLIVLAGAYKGDNSDIEQTGQNFKIGLNFHARSMFYLSNVLSYSHHQNRLHSNIHSMSLEYAIDVNLFPGRRISTLWRSGIALMKAWTRDKNRFSGVSSSPFCKGIIPILTNSVVFLNCRSATTDIQAEIKNSYILKGSLEKNNSSRNIWALNCGMTFWKKEK